MSNAKTLPNGHPGEIVLFSYPESIFGKRIATYLNLRGLPYSQIRVPPNMPRPLLQKRLGINYRRIPIMSIGRDIYIDTRLIMSKLESLFPDRRLGAGNSWDAGFEEILESWTIDGGLFWRIAGCIPPTAPLLQDKVWVQDRKEGARYHSRCEEEMLMPVQAPVALSLKRHLRRTDRGASVSSRFTSVCSRKCLEMAGSGFSAKKTPHWLSSMQVGEF